MIYLVIRLEPLRERYNAEPGTLNPELILDISSQYFDEARSKYYLTPALNLN